MAETRVSCAIKKFALSRGIKNPYEFVRKFTQFKRAIVRKWWAGKSVPTQEKYRELLFSMTGDPIFQGSLTRELKKKCMESPSKEELAYLQKLLREGPISIIKNERIDRLVHLVKAFIPDIVFFVTDGSEEERKNIRKQLGEDYQRLVIGARALASEENREVLKKEKYFEELFRKEDK